MARKPWELIGLSGPAGSGKDQAASAITAAFGHQQMAFADPLKRMLAAMLDVPVTAFDHREWKESWLGHPFGPDVTPRYLMQTLGTEWARDRVQADIWILLMARRLDHTPGPVVISDVRFENEAGMVRSLGGAVVHLYRRGGWSAVHRSEEGIYPHDSDHRLANTGSLGELQAQACDLVRLLRDAEA